ncbi:MAG: hypothetical protein JW763_08960 [candidate division Zixibacteria bacterium]|nr:hypothetical protein [candidate division Zixibacteria bacterium]
MITTICGNYPKIDHLKSRVNLRTAINRLESGKIDHEEYESILRQTFERTINDQLEAGIDIITDGQITWQDLFSPYCEALDNLAAGGLRRYFDNNVYYRRPQVTGEIRRIHPIVAESPVYSEMKPATAMTKAVLCGPVTFALHADDFHYGSIDSLATAVAEVIREEIVELQQLGVSYVQLDEPGLPERPEYVDLLARLVPGMLNGTDIRLGLAFYFSSLKTIASRLGEFPVDFLALDLVSHPDDMESLPTLDKYELHAGLIDARNIMLEDTDDVASRLTLLRQQVMPKRIVLTTSCGLEFLPRDYALDKMRHLVQLAAEPQVGTDEE